MTGTITTAQAAAEARVTVATIRAWARRGVIAATKQAGRWLIETASLARRILIGAMRARKAHPVIDLDATYVGRLAPKEAPEKFTVTVKKRTRQGAQLTIVRGIIPLLADKLDAIPDEGDRMACLNMLCTVSIVISDTADPDWDDAPLARESGQLRTTYRGGVPGVSVDYVLDLAAQIRAQLT